MTDFLETKRREINTRLGELKPLVDEYHQLEAAVRALAGVGGRSASSDSTPAKRGPGRPKGSRNRKATTGRRGRPRGTGTRAVQALELVGSNPGITISQLAERMGIKQNYLYRVLPGLEADGKVSKQGRGWHLGSGSSTAATAANGTARRSRSTSRKKAAKKR